MRIPELIVASALRIRSSRAALLSSNLANADVPGSMPRDIDFNSALKAAIANAQGAHDSIMPEAGDLTTSAVPQDLRPDGSGVDVSREMGEMFQNSLAYESTMKLYASMMARLKTATEV
ncbi:MAG: flagellar basal body rod protein FlgB [Candidatus Binataceae bacterium]